MVVMPALVTVRPHQDFKMIQDDLCTIPKRPQKDTSLVLYLLMPNNVT